MLFLIPLLLGSLLVWMLGLLFWKLMCHRKPKSIYAHFSQFDQTLMRFLILCAFSLGVFLTYFFTK